MHNKTFKIFLISITAIIIIGLVYIYIYKGGKTEAADSSPLSSSVETNDSASNTNNQTSLDISFISTLSSLKKIKIDNAFFDSKSFMSLKDNSVALEQVNPGRTNPFSPINTESLNSTSFSMIKTNEPGQISSNSAILNGSVDMTNSFSALYFEYGTTLALDKKTPNLEPSVIGNFMANISGLTSQTTYYYRSAVKMGDNTLYGEVESFTTN